MANIHTFSSIKGSGNNRNSGGRDYTPLNISPSQSTQNSSDSIFSVGVPDGEGNYKKVNIFQCLFPGFKIKSFVFAISMFQIALFIITCIFGWITPDPNNPDGTKKPYTDPLNHNTEEGPQDDQAFNCVLYKFGAKYTPAVLIYYHIHRLLLPVFLHANAGHVFFNILSQFFFGFHLEELYSTKKFIILYFTSAVGGNLLSTIQNTDNISVGASSALFGIFAFQVAYLIDNYENLGPRKNMQIFFIAMMLLGNVGGASATQKIDNSAHLGGFLVGGLIAALIMGKSNPESKFAKYITKLIAVLAAYFVITSIVLATMKPGDEVVSYSCSRVFKLW